MESIRKWFYRPKRDDTSLLAQFFYANEALTAVACELDSFDGRQEPERCTTLVNQLRHCQDKVLTICNQIMDELIPDCRANRDFRVKFPDDVMQENLAGQLWFGAECLAAGSSIMNREVESSAMRPLAKALTKSLEIVRNLLREHALKGHMNLKAQNPLESSLEKLIESLKIFDRLFADFELCYVAAMVPVKSTKEYEQQELVCVLFSETLQRALERGLLSQADVDNYEPALMFTIPRLAIVSGLLAPPGGPLCLNSADNISEMFRPFRNLLLKIRDLLWTLNNRELYMLEKLLCSNEEPSAPISQSTKTACQQDYEDFVHHFYTDYPNCKDFIVDFYTVTKNTGSNMDEVANDAVAIIDQEAKSRIEYLIEKPERDRRKTHSPRCPRPRSRGAPADDACAALSSPPAAKNAKNDEAQEHSHESPGSSGSGMAASIRPEPEPFLTPDISQMLGTSGNIEIPQTQYLLNQVSHENNVVTGEHIHVDNSLPDMDSRKLISEANKTLSSLLLEGECPHEISEQTDSGICTVISSENTSLYDKSPEEKKSFAGEIEGEGSGGATPVEESRSSCGYSGGDKRAELEENEAQGRSDADRATPRLSHDGVSHHRITVEVNGDHEEVGGSRCDSQGRSCLDRASENELGAEASDSRSSSNSSGSLEETILREPERQSHSQADRAMSGCTLRTIPRITTSCNGTSNEDSFEEQGQIDDQARTDNQQQTEHHDNEPQSQTRPKNSTRISSSFNGTNEEFVGIAYGNGQLTVCDSNQPTFQINYSENWESLNMNIDSDTNKEFWRELRGPSTSQDLDKITSNLERVPSKHARESKLKKRQRRLGKRAHDESQRSLSCGVRVGVRMSPSTESSRSNSTDRGLNPRLRSFGASLNPALNTRQMPNFGSQSPQRSPRLSHFEARASRKLLEHRRSRSEQLARMRKRRNEDLVNDGLGPRTDKSGLAGESPPDTEPVRPPGLLNPAVIAAAPSIEQVGSSSSGSSFADSSSETSEFQSDCQDDEEIALAMQAAEIANRNQIRAKFRSSEDLVHRLFVCIAGVADQLQTNFASDLRNILKCVFLMNSTAGDDATSITQQPNQPLESVEALTTTTSAVVERQDSLQDDDDVIEESNSTNERASPVTERGEECVERAPAWIPDTDAPRCMACQAGFTVVRRRHHCRNCGKVFCGRCSSNNVPLPRYGHTKPVRVCNRCFLYQVTPFTVTQVTPTS